jgi:transketolase C-terminal domain/subunit
VVKLNRVAPLDSDGICRALDGVKRIVAAEDQLRAGAVGERLSALLLEQGAGTEKLVLRSVGTTLPSQGSTVELRHALGLDAEGIAQAVREVLA